MLPKTKIRLSRHLRAQTTPYPEASRWLKRGIVMTLILFSIGIYFFTRPETRENKSPLEPKQILGEQQPENLEFVLYKVKKGDTLFNLAQKHGLTWQTLAEINQLEEPYILRIGQEVKIPITAD